MLDYEKLSHGLYDAVSQALRLIEQEQQSGTPDYRALYFHLFAVTEAVRHRLSKIEDE